MRRIYIYNLFVFYTAPTWIIS